MTQTPEQLAMAESAAKQLGLGSVAQAKQTLNPSTPNVTESALNASGFMGPGANSDSILNALTNKIMGQVGSISSSQNDYRELLQNAKQSIAGGAQANQQVVESIFGERREGVEQDIQDTVSLEQRSQRGFATNTALLDRIQTVGQKTINDLERQKTELILQGKADAAEKISNLQVKEAEFMIDSKQQIFSNLMNLASFQENKRQFEVNFQQREESIKQEETRFMANLSLQYGVDMQDGDTLEDVVSKAMPRINQMQALEMQDVANSIRLKQTQLRLAQEAQNAENVSPAVLPNFDQWSENQLSNPETAKQFMNNPSLRSFLQPDFLKKGKGEPTIDQQKLRTGYEQAIRSIQGRAIAIQDGMRTSLVSSGLTNKDQESANNTVNQYLANGHIDRALDLQKTVIYNRFPELRKEESQRDLLYDINSMVDEYLEQGGRLGWLNTTFDTTNKAIHFTTRIKRPIAEELAQKLNIAARQYATAMRPDGKIAQQDIDFFYELFPGVKNNERNFRNKMRPLTENLEMSIQSKYTEALGPINYNALFVPEPTTVKTSTGRTFNINL